MKSIFRSANHAETFEREGYLVIDFINQDALQSIRQVLEKSNLQPGDTFYSSSFLTDKEKKQIISRELEAIIDPWASSYFINYRKLGAVFLIKPSGPSGVMPIHQDWTVVDETKYDAITVWIALQDTTEHNGCIRVLPRSHRLSNALRAPTLPDPLQNIREEAEKLMQPLPLKAGQAFIFSHALIHASYPNFSKEPRIAVAYGVVHEEADLIYYFRENKDAPLELLSVPEDFFLNYPAPGERPEGGILVNIVKDPGLLISKEDFYKKISGQITHLAYIKSKVKKLLDLIKT